MILLAMLRILLVRILWLLESTWVILLLVVTLVLIVGLVALVVLNIILVSCLLVTTCSRRIFCLIVIVPSLPMGSLIGVRVVLRSVISLPFAEVGLLTTSIVVSLGRVIGSMAVLVAILVDLVQARIYAEKILHHFNRIFAVKKSSLNVINLKVLDLSIGKNSPWQYL
jgi:hypothetical protein